MRFRFLLSLLMIVLAAAPQCARSQSVQRESTASIQAKLRNARRTAYSLSQKKASVEEFLRAYLSAYSSYLPLDPSRPELLIYSKLSTDYENASSLPTQGVFSKVGVWRATNVGSTIHDFIFLLFAKKEREKGRELLKEMNAAWAKTYFLLPMILIRQFLKPDAQGSFSLDDLNGLKSSVESDSPDLSLVGGYVAPFSPFPESKTQSNVDPREFVEVVRSLADSGIDLNPFKSAKQLHGRLVRFSSTLKQVIDTEYQESTLTYLGKIQKTVESYLSQFKSLGVDDKDPKWALSLQDEVALRWKRKKLAAEAYLTVQQTLYQMHSAKQAAALNLGDENLKRLMTAFGTTADEQRANLGMNEVNAEAWKALQDNFVPQNDPAKLLWDTLSRNPGLISEMEWIENLPQKYLFQLNLTRSDSTLATGFGIWSLKIELTPEGAETGESSTLEKNLLFPSIQDSSALLASPEAAVEIAGLLQEHLTSCHLVFRNLTHAPPSVVSEVPVQNRIQN